MVSIKFLIFLLLPDGIAMGIENYAYQSRGLVIIFCALCIRKFNKPNTVNDSFS